MKTLRNLFILVALSLSCGLSAQSFQSFSIANKVVQLEAVAGVGLSTFTGYKPDYGENKAAISWRLGVGGRLEMPNLAPSVFETVGVHAQFLLVQKGKRYESGESDYDHPGIGGGGSSASEKSSDRPIYIQVPVTYYGKMGKMGFEAGLYMALGIAGKHHFDFDWGFSNGYDTGADEKRDFFGDGVRRFDMGLELGLTYDITDKIYGAINYNQGFIPLSDGGEYKNMDLHFGLGYRF